MSLNLDIIEEIRRLAIQALVSDDKLMELLVLKGGSAVDLVHGYTERASMDIDFSMEGDFEESEYKKLKVTIERLLEETYLKSNYVINDYKCDPRPSERPKNMPYLWGGYEISYKVISKDHYDRLKGNIESVRRESIPVDPSNSTKFSIQISKYEYCKNKVVKSLGGYTIFVYAPELLVAEKLRAICQQMPGYEAYIPSIKPTARARDFFDIYTIIQNSDTNLSEKLNMDLVKEVFDAKRVPLDYLRRIGDFREFHRSDFISVEATVKSRESLKNYDYYFDFVISIISRL
jgi:predicted nucleotidyltransferase component of viral defense system